MQVGLGSPCEIMSIGRAFDLLDFRNLLPKLHIHCTRDMREIRVGYSGLTSFWRPAFILGASQLF